MSRFQSSKYTVEGERETETPNKATFRRICEVRPIATPTTKEPLEFVSLDVCHHDDNERTLCSYSMSCVWCGDQVQREQLTARQSHRRPTATSTQDLCNVADLCEVLEERDEIKQLSVVAVVKPRLAWYRVVRLEDIRRR